MKNRKILIFILVIIAQIFMVMSISYFDFHGLTMSVVAILSGFLFGLSIRSIRDTGGSMAFMLSAIDAIQQAEKEHRVQRLRLKLRDNTHILKVRRSRAA